MSEGNESKQAASLLCLNLISIHFWRDWRLGHSVPGTPRSKYFGNVKKRNCSISLLADTRDFPIGFPQVVSDHRWAAAPSVISFGKWFRSLLEFSHPLEPQINKSCLFITYSKLFLTAIVEVFNSIDHNVIFIIESPKNGRLNSLDLSTARICNEIFHDILSLGLSLATQLLSFCEDEFHSTSF